jgi:hypothetical protein
MTTTRKRTKINICGISNKKRRRNVSVVILAIVELESLEGLLRQRSNGSHREKYVE